VLRPGDTPDTSIPCPRPAGKGPFVPGPVYNLPKGRLPTQSSHRLTSGSAHDICCSTTCPTRVLMAHFWILPIVAVGNYSCTQQCRAASSPRNNAGETVCVGSGCHGIAAPEPRDPIRHDRIGIRSAGNMVQRYVASKRHCLGRDARSVPGAPTADLGTWPLAGADGAGTVTVTFSIG